MKRILVWVLILGAGLCGAAFWAAGWLEKSWLPRQLDNMAILGKPARFAGPPSVSWAPPALLLGECSWEGRFYGMKASLSARSVRIVPDILSLWGSQPELKEIVVDKPVICLETREAATAGAPYARDEEAGGSSAWSVGIERFVAQDGSLRYVDGGRELILENLRISGENLRPRHDAGLQCDFGLRARSGGAEILNGNFAMKTWVRYYAPNLTFRDGSATFTVIGPESLKVFSPSQAQFDGAFNFNTFQGRVAAASVDAPPGRVELAGETGVDVFSGKGRLELDMTKIGPAGGVLAVDSPFVLKHDTLELRGADVSWGGFQAAADIDVHSAAVSDRVLDLLGQWADGTLQISLDKRGAGFQLRLLGDRISLGEALRQFGIHGFAGGPTHLSGDLYFSGLDFASIKNSAKGNATLECSRLKLEPFGEIALLLPLLGQSGALMPKLLNSLKMALRVAGGRLDFTTISAAGPEFGASGSATVDLDDDMLGGQLVVRALGLELPIVFSGPVSCPDVRVEPGLLKHKD